MRGLTNFLNDSQQQNYNADTLFRQMVAAKHLPLEQVLHYINKCPSLRQDAELLTELFYSKKQVIQDLIDWMFQPDKIIAKRFPNQKSELPHSQNSKLYRHMPFLCKNWIKDNEFFYQFMVQAAVRNQLPIERWFFFLYDKNSCFLQSPTFITSMGYFTQVMIPFVNSIDTSFVRQSMKLAANNQSSVSMHSFSQSIKTSSMRNKSIVSSQSDKKDEIVLLGIFKQYLLDKLIENSCFDGIFKFVYTMCLRSLQENQRELSNVRLVLVKLFDNFSTLLRKQYARNQLENWLQNLLSLLKQLQNNMKSDSEKVLIFIQAIDESKLPANFCAFILDSAYFNDILDQQQQNRMFSSTINQQERGQDMKEILKRSQGMSQLVRKSMKKHSQTDRVEQYIIQLMLESLTYIIKLCQKVVCPNVNNSIKEIFDKVPFILKIVKQKTTRKVMQFSSGENVTQITILKHNCLKMLFQTISMFCRFNQVSQFKPILNLKKQQIYKIVERYLSENRWNNIAHHTLEKLTEIINSPYCRLQKSQKVNNDFLSYLIQNFMNNRYVYLQTLHFTSQGNLYSLYIMSKQKARYLNTNKKLLISLKEFEPWKKFLTNDLNNFQESLSKSSVPVSGQMVQKMRRNSQSQAIAIDQVDSIKKLLEEVEQQLSWQKKLQKKRVGMMLKSCVPISNHSRKKIVKKYSDIEMPIMRLQKSQLLDVSDSSDQSMHNFLPSSQTQLSMSNLSQLKGSMPISPPTLTYSAKKSSEFSDGIQRMQQRMRQSEKVTNKKMVQSQIFMISKVKQEQHEKQRETKQEIRGKSFIQSIPIVKNQ